jgi:hypothetical protein
MSFYTFGSNGLQWSPSSDRVFFTQVDRGPKHVRLFVADPSTGSTRQVLADSSAAYVIGTVDLALTGSPTNWRVLKNGDLIHQASVPAQGANIRLLFDRYAQEPGHQRSLGRFRRRRRGRTLGRCT